MTVRLPNEAERALYRDVVAQGGMVLLREAMEQDPDAALGLIGLGLLLHHDHGEMLTAAHPGSFGARLSAELRNSATGKLRAAEHAAAQLEDLAQAYDAAARRGRSARPLQLVAGPQISHHIARIESEMREETLAAQPGGARPIHDMRQTRARSLGFLASGIELRSIYQPGALLDPPTVSYAAELTAAGERFRVLDEPFRRMVIFDRRAAVVSAAPDDRQAVLVEDPAVLTTLVALFERDWARAERVDWQALAGRPRESGVPSELTDLLAAGLTQRAIASRLGLSERTVAGHIARLREFYDAETLFQLGWQLRGVSGRPTVPPG
ncbi:LuxR family transcriptional regulator [Kitasatospora sp. NA04385]|uniref:LuxR family transcriptional regulator n=1 Tax=Kitasatospora sp. NA04385 TaxID=2742135 RepID=UPI00159127B9|nr:LuxR family transcriptional regulator [Kitasatospora sp. NA04385]QKW20677.1 LuxR family transcriptional regulator [Kitasatospora sp. NA04385]